VHDQPVRLDERQGVEDPDEALEGDVVRGQRDVRPARSDIDGAREVTTLHAEAGGASVRPHDDVAGRREPSRRPADFETPVGGS